MTTAGVSIVVAVVTALLAIIGFAAVLARASTSAATIEALRGDVTDRQNRIDQLKDDLATEREERQKLQEQVSVLDERVTQRARVDDLAHLVANNHRENLAALRVLTDDLEILKAALAGKQDT